MRLIGADGNASVHWLDHDGVTIAVLMTAIGILELLVLSI
jgi:hypothetical protein